jgi:hypothetical protein
VLPDCGRIAENTEIMSDLPTVKGQCADMGGDDELRSTVISQINE